MDVAYMISNTYEEWWHLQQCCIDEGLTLLYVYAPQSLLALDPPPSYLVNTFDLTSFKPDGPQFWVDGKTPYQEADSLITDVVTRLSERGCMIFSDLEGLLYHLRKRGTEYEVSSPRSL